MSSPANLDQAVAVEAVNPEGDVRGLPHLGEELLVTAALSWLRLR